METFSSGEKTFGYKQCVIKESKIETLYKRITFQVQEDYQKIFVIQSIVPYEIQMKLKKKTTLQQEALLGKGSFGNVYLTKHLALNIECATKVHENILFLNLGINFKQQTLLFRIEKS